ncbi:E3 ubiquitin ligase BIG BROTHER-related-like isoform X2 [Salvia splendens]|uniref:E3 ubiquitin ligase BIG BROTHER-related-like isoform X2 n=1 Tax=Salvia splendens TaxID=180675 RepID=UPI001C26422D|nr:E3 ubiquitin ligase BIG BROTHER-related-like isoform X2 [Salvia splendens]
MENTNDKADSGNQENPNDPCNPTNDNDNPISGDVAGNRPQRTPFTDLSQVDADLALARTLQEQERAYMMLRMGGDGGRDSESWETESYDDFDEEDYDESDVEMGNGEVRVFDEDAHADVFDEDAHAEGEDDDEDGQDVELDPSAFPDDEAYARALQDAEEREMAARLLALAGINESEDDDEDEEDHDGNSQDALDEVDPDELSYEELLALSEVVGTESRGLPAETIASLPSINYKSQGSQEGISDSCVICRLDFEDDDTLILLSCKHSYHSECINSWLQINKVCPVCSAEVPTSQMS